MIQKILLPMIFLLLIPACNCGHEILKDADYPSCYPEEEKCNLKDDDCDGFIDEDITINCSTACGDGTSTCQNGEMTSCSVQKPALDDKICNNVDDDCDGQIDEDIGVDFFYPKYGERNEIPMGECRPGIRYCKSGVFVEINPILPRPEVCDGEGKDEDCDGQIDEDLLIGPLDIILVLDESCSMNDDITSLINATTRWAEKYSTRTNLKFALVLASSRYQHLDRMVVLEKNFSNAQDFVDVLKIQTSGDTAFEATIDAVYNISTPSNPLKLSWTPGSRKIIIVYTDENPQSYQTPILTEQQAIYEATTNGIIVYVLTSSYYLSTWSKWNAQIFPELNPQGPTHEKKLDEIIAVNSCKIP